MQITPKIVALVGTGVAVAALGIAVPTMAFAQDPAPATLSSNSPSASTDPAATDRQQRQAERQDTMAELLARELGLDKDTVAAALDAVESQLRDQADTQRQAALKERLDAAVSAGTLTQEQADAVLAAAAAGVLGGGMGGGHGHPGPGR